MLMIELDKSTSFEAWTVWEYEYRTRLWNRVRSFSSLRSALAAFPSAFYQK